MFGYVTIGKNQLTQEEYDVFTSYYCGVCKATGKTSSHSSRLGLSYDITFLALVLSSLFDDGETVSERCIIHPIKKRKCQKNDMSVEFSAKAGVILNYLKLKDDWHDERSIKALLAMPAFYKGFIKARKSLLKEYAVIKKQLDILSELEKSNSKSLDDTADAFAKILEVLFTPDFIKDEKEKRVLGWFGYNLGRWLYIIDAVNDLEDDIKSGAYNPLKAMGYTELKKCAEDIELSLTLSLDGIASAFELMNFKRNKEIVGKVVYVTLKEKQQYILNGSGKENK